MSFLGKQEEALAAFEKGKQINPKDADVSFEIGKIRLQKGDRDGARAAFRKLPNWIHQTPIISGPSLELPRQRNSGIKN